MFLDAGSGVIFSLRRIYNEYHVPYQWITIESSLVSLTGGVVVP